MKLKAIQGGQQGGAITSGVEPYGFAVEFERALITLCCSNRDVYSRVGAQLEPKALSEASAQHLLKAVQAIASEMGEGPSSTLTVAQRLKAWREDGKITHEQIKEAGAYLDAAEDAGLPNPAEVIKEAAIVLKKRAQRASVKKALDTMAKGGDFRKLGEEIAATERIGEAELTLGDSLHSNVLDVIAASNNSSRFSSGCTEFDHACGGGLPLGYTLFLGREKSGKSMVLSSIAADAIWRGKNVAIATLELDTHKQLERVLANLLDIPLDEIQGGSELSKRRYKQIENGLGKITAKRFSPETPATEITRWVERVQETWEAKVDLLVVDYIDLVGSGKKGEDSDYKAQKIVGNIFRDHALQHRYYVISASQARRSSGGLNKGLDVDDVADSMHKVRIADLVIAMRMNPDTKDMVDWYVILNRNGTDRTGTGELPTCRAMAQMFPVARPTPWHIEANGYGHRHAKPTNNYEY